ncbi:MAG: ATP-binding protein [Terracidiphilus sp.]
MYFFLSGTYHKISASARSLVAKSMAFIDLHPIEPPTRMAGELYATANVRTIQETFEKLLPKPTAFMIYAPPGSQKSFVLEYQVAKLNLAEMANAENGRRAFYIYARQNLRPRDLVRRVAIACGCRVSNEIDLMLAGIRFEFRSHRVLLIIDEANHLSIECFEILRELLDRPPYFSLLFAGSHDLKRKFDEFSATLEQWNSRIIAKVRLPGLERDEARGIIEREIGELLRARTAGEAKRLTDNLIASATVRDAFEGNRTYINVRTLTNALDQIKAAAAERSVSVIDGAIV